MGADERPNAGNAFSEGDERGLYAAIVRLAASSFSSFSTAWVYFYRVHFDCIVGAQEQVRKDIDGKARCVWVWARRPAKIKLMKNEQKMFDIFLAFRCKYLRELAKTIHLVFYSLCVSVSFLLENRPYPPCNKPEPNNKNCHIYFSYIYAFYLIVAFDSFSTCSGLVFFFAGFCDRNSKQRPNHQLEINPERKCANCDGCCFFLLTSAEAEEAKFTRRVARTFEPSPNALWSRVSGNSTCEKFDSQTKFLRTQSEPHHVYRYPVEI